MPPETLQSLTAFYTNKNGVGAEPSCSSSQSGSERYPFILNYTANLDGSIALPFYNPSKCDPKYIVLQCHCGRQIIPSSCMGLDCTGCSEHVKQRRSNSVFRRLLNPTPGLRRRYNRKTVIYSVFTVPFELRVNYINPKEWQKVRRKAWKILKQYFGGLYGVEASHPSGDKDETVFHPHLNFLWIQRDGWKPFLDVDRLRELWANCLNVEIADVYTQYSTNVRQIKHWTNYVCRTFPGTHKWTGPLRWYGKYPRIKRDTTTMCPECGHHFHSVGWIEKWKVDDYYKNGYLCGTDPPWFKDDEVHRYKK